MGLYTVTYVATEQGVCYVYAHDIYILYTMYIYYVCVYK